MRLRWLFQTTYYLLAVLLVLIIILFVGSKLPLPWNYEIMSVMSGSMEPAIKMGSLVIVRPSEAYLINDIITFGQVSKHKIPTTHRIIEIEGPALNPFFTTKGDANEAPDPQRIRKSEIIGKVLFSLPYFGFAIDFVRKPLGFFLVIIVPALIIIGDELRKIWHEIGRKKELRKGEFRESTQESTQEPEDDRANGPES